MRLKGNRNRLTARGSRPCGDLCEYTRVRPVHAVKIADTHEGGPVARGNVFKFVKNVHKGEIVDRRQF